jgi:hypothetical protein
VGKRALIVTLAVAAGCGFERESPYAGRRVPDVAPWQDLGPLTVCGGGQRIVAPSLGNAGLCLPRPDERSCSADADCKHRERCLCGLCSVAVCDSADECGPPGGDFVCSFSDRRCDHACDTDAECAAGERCVPGRHVCRGLCSSTADCQRGESCQSSTGLCVITACAAGDECGGRACALQRIGALLAEPTPLFAAGAAVDLWLERTDADAIPRIWHGHGDGTAFVLDDAPLFAGAAPSAARLPDGSVALVFALGVNLYATRSSDGIAWSAPTPALPNARQPSLVVLPDGTPLLYAIDPDGNLTRFAGDANLVFDRPVSILTPADVRTPLWPDVDALASPFAELYTEPDAGAPLRVRLWFAAHGTESAPSMQFGSPVPSAPDYSIGLAVSLDAAQFTIDAYGPVFERTTDFINHPSELDPAVVRLGERWLLYYRRAKPDGSAGETLAVATSPAIPR